MLKFMLGVAVGFGAAVLLLKREFDMRVEDIRIEELEKRSKDAMKVKDEADKAIMKYSGETEENEDIVYEIESTTKKVKPSPQKMNQTLMRMKNCDISHLNSVLANFLKKLLSEMPVTRPTMML